MKVPRVLAVESGPGGAGARHSKSGRFNGFLFRGGLFGRRLKQPRAPASPMR